MTHCKRGHEFTAANTYVSPDGWRHCKRCDMAQWRIAHGWPEDLAYSAPKSQWKPPEGLVRVTPPVTRNLSEKRSHCARGHEMTDENVYVTPKGYRQCRPCRTAAVYRFIENPNSSQSDGAGK